MSASRIFTAVLLRDCHLAWRSGGAGLALAFFVLTLVLLPLAIGTDGAKLRLVGPGLVWIAALLAMLLTLERIFQADLEAGVVDLMASAPLPLGAVVFAKGLAHWLSVCLPLICIAPVGALLLGLPAHGIGVLVLSLLLGTPGLSLTGVLLAALVAGAHRFTLLIIWRRGKEREP